MLKRKLKGSAFSDPVTIKSMTDAFEKEVRISIVNYRLPRSALTTFDSSNRNFRAYSSNTSSSSVPIGTMTQP